MTPHSAKPISSYRDLTAWKAAIELVVELYTISRHFPADERFGLTAQLRRAAVSIPANLAEGNARFSRPDYRRFVSMARGSLAEIETLLVVAERLDYVKADELRPTVVRTSRIGGMLTNLWKALGSEDSAAAPASP